MAVSRLKDLLTAVGIVVGLILLNAIFNTLGSLYPGTGSIRPFGPSEKTGNAVIGQCQRVGPVSSYGLGYWWDCQALVEMSDGRTVTTTLRHSVATADDQGRQIEIREACVDDNKTECTYGRPINPLWGIALGALRIIRWGVTIVLLFAAGLNLASAALGHRRFVAVLRKLTNRR
jgi:hypothetical protein